MARVEKDIEVEVPLHVAYEQWTQFEEFPRFMDGVEEVRQLDDRHLRWTAIVGGKREEWDAVIREQVPDQRIIWQNTSGAENAGVVRFDRLGERRTRVHLEMSYDPEGFVEHVGDALGFVDRRVKGDLQRFKDFIESRGQPTGAWRGTIENPDVPGGHTEGRPAGGPVASNPPSGNATAPGEMGPGGSMSGGAESGMPGDRALGGAHPEQSGGMGGEYPERRGGPYGPGAGTGTSYGGPSASTGSTMGADYDREGGMGGEYPERASGVEDGVGLHGGDSPGNSRRDVVGGSALNDDVETSAGDTGRGA